VVIIDLELAIKYLSDKSESTNKIHWVLIGLGLFWYLTAVITTWLVLTEKGIYVERDPLAATAFEYLGMIPTFLIMLVIISVIMLYVPYTFRNDKWMGLIINACFVLFFVLDGGHNAAILAGDNIILNIPYGITENIMIYLGV
jgi:hypothetical protein